MVEWSFIYSLSTEFDGCKIVDADRHANIPSHEWCLNGVAVAWERPLSKRDLAALGASAPKGRVLAVRVQDLTVRDARLEAAPGTCFTSLHFANYPAVLVDMELAYQQLVRELFDVGVFAVNLIGR